MFDCNAFQCTSEILQWAVSTQMTGLVLISAALGLRLVLPVGCVQYINLIVASAVCCM